MTDIIAHTMEYNGGPIESCLVLIQYADEYFEPYKQIYEKCFHEMRTALELEPVDCCGSREVLLSKADCIFLLIENEELIGSVALYENEIDDLIVCTQHRRKGYGRALLNYAICYLQRKERFPITLHVADWNQSAISLYLKSGFSISKTEIIKRIQ